MRTGQRVALIGNDALVVGTVTSATRNCVWVRWDDKSITMVGSSQVHRWLRTP